VGACGIEVVTRHQHTVHSPGWHPPSPERFQSLPRPWRNLGRGVGVVSFSGSAEGYIPHPAWLKGLGGTVPLEMSNRLPRWPGSFSFQH
jgi:hypothetical protein